MPTPQTLQNMVVKLNVHVTTVFVFRAVLKTLFSQGRRWGWGDRPRQQSPTGRKMNILKEKLNRAQQILNY
jgi:hypothetical protein